jgi:hypothetical protein
MIVQSLKHECVGSKFTMYHIFVELLYIEAKLMPIIITLQFQLLISTSILHRWSYSNMLIHNNTPANRTRHVLRKPRVNTFRMKHVLTKRNHLHRITLSKLFQTNHTVRLLHIFLILTNRQWLHGGEI